MQGCLESQHHEMLDHFLLHLSLVLEVGLQGFWVPQVSDFHLDLLAQSHLLHPHLVLLIHLLVFPHWLKSCLHDASAHCCL